MRQRLSPELRSLVREMGAALGRVVERSEGRPAFLQVEAVRRRMVLFRDGRAGAKGRALREAGRLIARLPAPRRAALARAYTLYLELVNVCENACRTRRLRARPAKAAGGSRLTFVLTAHPTESRSPDNIRVLRRIQSELVSSLGSGPEAAVAKVEPLLRLLWRVSIHPPRKPRPEDEAAHLYSLLSDELLEELLALRARGHDVRLRTWVGGDRDGHPGVGSRQLWASLRLARARLMSYLRAPLAQALADAEALPGPAARRVAEARRALERLRRVEPGDGGRVRRFSNALERAERAYGRAVGAAHPALDKARGLLTLFPGLVMPLELRDEAGAFGPGDPVSGLLEAVRSASRGGAPRSYAQGLVVSRVESARDVLEAQRAIRRVFGAPALPVIPLLESPSALRDAVRVLDGCWKDASFRRALRERGSLLEVMLGYSDSAKRMGALPSRAAIRRAMKDVSRWSAARGQKTVFFHGSGGSEGRGGGTVEEQASILPRRSLGLIKLTLQGEMVERTLATPEILRSNVLHWAGAQRRPPAAGREHPLTARLARPAQAEFARLAADPGLVTLLKRATPYSRLRALRIGSRPHARRKEAGLDSVRAIPWVLCWTQTRLLLPAWYGMGAAWDALRAEGVSPRLLRAAVAADPLLRSYVRQLDFALAKCEPLIWAEYVRRLAPDAAPSTRAAIDRELKACARFLRAAAPGGPLRDRPWLKESIFYRAPMIHPLNLLQIETLARKAPDAALERLFRETVTGIAAGMLTTG